MDVIAAIHTRRSIRSYEPRRVERSLIESIIADAAWAPPPVSGQTPWTFNVIEGVERLSVFGDIARQYAIDHHPDEPGWTWTTREGFKVFWDAPVVVVISGRVEDGCRAGQNLLLSAHARGLGACWVGAPMLWLRTLEAKQALAIPTDLTPAAAICLGYPKAVPPPPPRTPPPVIWLD